MFKSLRSFAWFSFLAALLTLVIKVAAYFLTNSVGLLSEVMDSSINVISGCMLLLVTKQRHKNHQQPNTNKGEYWVAGLEGALVCIGGLGVAYTAIVRLQHPIILQHIHQGLGLTAIAALIDCIIAVIINRGAHRYHNLALKANAAHMITDAMTTLGLLLSLILMSCMSERWHILDPIIALVIAAGVLRTGISLVYKAIRAFY
jgi:cation diffusion facilitator family transporter